MYEDFKDMVEDLQLVIPSTFEECFTYELQILYLKQLIDNIEPGGDYQEEIDNINRKLVTLQSEVTKLKNDVNNLNPDEVQRKLDAMQTEINCVKTSIQTITQNVTTLTGNVNTNTTDIETLTGEMTNVKNTLNNKQNVLTFDATPTSCSNNPVTSDGIKKAIDAIAGGGGGGGTGESEYVVKTLTSSLSLNLTNKKTVTYELSPSGVVRHTDIEIGSISVVVGTDEKILINLPKAENTWSHEILACYVQLKNIGGSYAQVPVKTKNTGVILSVDAGPIIMDINNHLYIVFVFYNLIPIS